MWAQSIERRIQAASLAFAIIYCLLQLCFCAQFNRKILSRVLVKLGYQVLEASTGEEAVEAFRREIRADARSDLLCVLLVSTALMCSPTDSTELTMPFGQLPSSYGGSRL